MDLRDGSYPGAAAGLEDRTGASTRALAREGIVSHLIRVNPNADLESTFNPNSDLESTFNHNADLESTFNPNADLESTFNPNADLESTFNPNADLESTGCC